MDEFYTIISQDGTEKGKAHIDEDLQCEIEGCNGSQYVVTWEDGEQTICCGCGLKWIDESTAQII